MGQAFDERGQPLGPGIIGPNRREVLEKLEELYPDSAEVRIRKLKLDQEEEIEVAIVRSIDAKMGDGWCLRLAEALGLPKEGSRG